MRWLHIHRYIHGHEPVWRRYEWPAEGGGSWYLDGDAWCETCELSRSKQKAYKDVSILDRQPFKIIVGIIITLCLPLMMCCWLLLDAISGRRFTKELTVDELRRWWL